MSNPAGLKGYVLAALTDAAGMQFNFSIQDYDYAAEVPVTTAGLMKVAAAIRADCISIRPLSEYNGPADAGAAYRNEADTIYVPESYLTPGGPDTAFPGGKFYQQSTVLHEAVHAHFDLIAARAFSRASGEAASYLVQMMYCDLRRVDLPASANGSDTFGQILQEAKFKLSDARTPAKKFGKDSLDSLRDAIKKHYVKLDKNYKGDLPIPGLGVKKCSP